VDSKRNKVLVIGDSCEDVFVYGDCTRICPEAPVPVFNPVSLTSSNPGMAGNVLTNLVALGYNAKLRTQENRITKTRYIDNKSNQMLIRVDSNDTAEPIEVIDEAYIKSFDIVIVSDYNKGFLTEDDMEKIASLHDWAFLDTKKYLGDWSRHFRYIKINEIEYAINEEAIPDMDEMADQLIVTLGERGCRHSNISAIPDKQIQTIDVSGAGDTFMAAFATKVFETNDVSEAMCFANTCSLKVVQQRGVTTI
jgi:D-glycero-beta-D-manno-heptose-7-phosphate kinase